MNEVIAEVCSGVGLITLNRPKALNALSLDMIRALTAALAAWRDDASVQAVAIRGMGKGVDQTPVPFGAFCAGGDIRFFHAAALAGNPQLEDFFTEEYSLNHLVFTYPKPYLAFMDGIVMGGGMGLCQRVQRGAEQGAPARRLRVVTERTKMAMPETGIGLFPDVGGGYFLSRCPGHWGEYLALTGDTIGGQQAIDAGLADVLVQSAALPAWWQALATHGVSAVDWPSTANATNLIAAHARQMRACGQIDAIFGLESISDMLQALQHDGSPWALEKVQVLRKRSPLMLHVVLQQVRRARHMALADELRMERDLVRHCFSMRHLQRHGAATETVEGIRALAVDKDHAPRWNPQTVEDVTPAMVEPFFNSPWPAGAHPLRHLA